MQPNQMNVYIAAPFFKSEQLATVVALENLLSHNGITYYSPRSEGKLQDMTPEQRKERMSYLFNQNIAHLDWCTHVLAVIDNYDTGTVWEMGYAFAKHKQIVTFTDHYYGINVMLNESIVGHCQKVFQIIPALMGEAIPEKRSDVV